MSVTEDARHDMFTRFREVVGPETATTMMHLLPPAGWADMATKHDLEQGIAVLESDLGHFEQRMSLRFENLEQRMDLRFETLEHKLHGAIDRAITAQTRVFVGWMLAILLTVVAATTGIALV